MPYKKIFFFLLFIGLIVVARVYQLDQYLTLDSLKHYKEVLVESYEANVLLFSLAYIAIYVLSVDRKSVV